MFASRVRGFGFRVEVRGPSPGPLLLWVQGWTQLWGLGLGSELGFRVRRHVLERLIDSELAVEVT